MVTGTITSKLTGEKCILEIRLPGSFEVMAPVTVFMGYFEDIQRIVRKIPRGKVATYGSVARAAGYPGTARQVAWALRTPSASRLPWQRVLGAGGKILLPDEAGLHQRMLLETEGVQFKGARVDMKRCEFRFRMR